MAYSVFGLGNGSPSISPSIYGFSYERGDATLFSSRNKSKTGKGSPEMKQQHGAPDKRKMH